MKNHYSDRFNLAIESKRFSLARYLARSLDARRLEEAGEWLNAQNQPEKFVAAWLDYADTRLTKQLFAYAVERLAFDDPIAASKHWRKLASHFSFSVEQLNRVSRHNALWAARLHLPQAAEMLSSLPDEARDVETGRWLVRTQLLQRQWSEVADSIDALPADEARKDEWRYWRAVALQEFGHADKAAEIFADIAVERSYYGFLAADAINSPYALTAVPALQNQDITNAIAERPELIRARELFFVGLEGRGRSEWDGAVRLMTSDEQTQAALLADSWGWHSRAISTASSTGLDDDLDLRFPTPWKKTFSRLSDSASINTTWVYGIARSESLFMPDVSSSAGAIGLMQLMPLTGAETARKANIRYKGRHSLVQPETNIALGTRYLAEMMERFNNNQVMATAAYNAGPHRVQRWLPKAEFLPADAWVDSVPFRETRRYVRRVLAAQTVFDWRMGSSEVRLSDRMIPVPDKITGRVSNQSNEVAFAGL
jgi:soluble lytic murein transglycosylase